MPLRPARLAIAVAWTALVLAGLFLPGRFLPGPGPVLTTLAHFVFFAGLVGLWSWAVPRLSVLFLVLGVFVAVGTEAFQAEVVPGRGVETRDLWADFVGIGLGWALAKLWRRRRTRLAAASHRRPAPRSRPRTDGEPARRAAGSSVHA